MLLRFNKHGSMLLLEKSVVSTGRQATQHPQRPTLLQGLLQIGRLTACLHARPEPGPQKESAGLCVRTRHTKVCLALHCSVGCALRCPVQGHCWVCCPNLQEVWNASALSCLSKGCPGPD